MGHAQRLGRWAVLLTIAAAPWGGLTGCHSTQSGTAGRNADGEKYLLTAEPTPSQSVVETRGALEGQTAAQEVVLVGRIDGLSQPTWDPQRAAFMLADLSLEAKSETDQAHDATPKHDAENCPFCKAKTKKELSGLAMIEVIDEQDTVVPVDARKLLGLQDGQVVVVRGRGQVDDLGNLVVRASGLYVRP